MKKLSTLVGILALTAVSLQASGIASFTRSPKDNNETHRRRYGNSSRNRGEECSNQMYTCLNEIDNFLSIGYIGGNIGPLNTVYAQTGAFAATDTDATKLARGYEALKPVWLSGVEVTGNINIMDGEAFEVNYMYMFKRAATNSVTKSPDYVDLTTTKDNSIAFANSDPILATTQIINAKATYTIDELQELSISSITPLIEQNRALAFARLGVVGGRIKHTSKLEAQKYHGTNTLRVKQENTISDSDIHFGPLAGLTLAKDISDGIYLIGDLNMSMHMSNIKHSVVSESKTYQDAVEGKDVNSSGTIRNFYPKTYIKLAAAYSFLLGTEIDVYTEIGYNAAFAPKSSGMFGSQTGTADGGLNTDIYWSLVNITLGASF